jgi:long-chain acyl-CoA synthetase
VLKNRFSEREGEIEPELSTGDHGGRTLTIRTLCDILRAREEGPERPHLLRYRTAGGWKEISSAEFLATARSLALGLGALGIRPGERVALLSENRPEWAAFDQALLNLGAVVVPLYPNLLPDQIRFILHHSQSRAIILSTPAQLAKLQPVLGALPDLGRLIFMDPPTAMPPQALVWTSLVREGEAIHREDPNRFETMRSAVRVEDLASILYTSGTTGEPKGVMLSHGNLAANIRSTLESIPVTDRSTDLSFLPLSHAFERIVHFTCLAVGATIAYAESIETVARDILEVQPTYLAGVPRMFEKVHARIEEGLRGASAGRRLLFRFALALGRRRTRAELSGRPAPLWTRGFLPLAERWVFSPLRRKTFGGRIEFVVSGAAPLPREIAEFFFAVGIPVREGYGLTEASPVISVNTPSRTRLGTVGPPLPGVEVRIAEDQEILVRGANVMQGYLRDEEATRAALTDGWLRTGDIGRLEDGFLVITDRKKEVLKTSGGKMIAPQPLENRLKADRAVAQAVVLGDGRKYVTALLVPDFGWLASYARHKGISAADANVLVKDPRVVDHYRRVVEARMDGLPSFERVKKFRLLPRELTPELGELTPTLKLKRRIIEQRHSELIASMYQD